AIRRLATQLGWLLSTTAAACGGSAKDGAGQAATQTPMTVDSGLVDEAGTTNPGGSGMGSAGGVNGSVGNAAMEIPAPNTGEVTGNDPTLVDNDAHVSLDDLDHTDQNIPTVPDGIPGFFWSGGIGNWFQTLPDEQVSDAVVENFDPPRGESAKACHRAKVGRHTCGRS
ncbi:MAG TPA: hypothetical protein VHO25_16560, partial [Polyangiaceae bacterium]|nr:hypothetical protein [Polyangiaceae bacterium]